MAHASIDFAQFMSSDGKVWKASKSQATLTVDATAGDPNVFVPAVGDFGEPGLGVVLFGAGPAIAPPVPSFTSTVVAPAGTPTAPMDVAIAAISENMGASAALLLSVSAPVALDGTHFVRLTPTAPVVNVYQYIVWARRGGAWQYLGGMIANPMAFAELARFDVTALTAVPVPEYLPADPPAVTQPEWLRTRIASIEPMGPGQPIRIALDDAPTTSVAGKTLAHDNSMVLQRAIASGIRRITVPIGGYRMFGNVTIDASHKPVHLEGELLQYDVEVEVPLSPIFEFTPGFGLVVLLESCTFENLVFRGRSRWTPGPGVVPRGVPSLPAGGRFISEDGFHGAGVLVMRRSVWINCVFSLFHGSGHAMWGVADYNPNMSLLERCVSNKNTAHGFYGGNGFEASDLAWMRCYAEGNHGWGFYDTGYLGNHLYGCHTYGNVAGPYRLAADDSAGCSTLIASYAEENQGPSIAGPKAVVVGGNISTGFTPSTEGLRIMSRNNVSPHFIRRMAANGETWFTREMATPAAGAEADSANESLMQLERHVSAREPMDFFTYYQRNNYIAGVNNKTIQRIQYQAANTTSMGWCFGELRGKSLMVFPRGFLIQGSNDAGLERRVLGLGGVDSPSYGTFEPGDFIMDQSGKNYFFRPRTRCGAGVPWAANHGYIIGDTVEPSVPNGRVYVARYLLGGAARSTAGLSGATEPASWPTTAGDEVTDGEVVWMCWGANQPDFEVVGRQTLTAATPALSIPAHETVDQEFVQWEALPADTVVATPVEPPPAGLMWNGWVTAGRAKLRLANLHAASLSLPAMSWTIDCWKH